MASAKRRRGSVRLKYPPDRWEVRLYLGLDPETGKQRSASRLVRGHRKDADDVLADLILNGKRETLKPEVTLDQLLTRYIQFLSRRGRSPLTLKGYRSIAKQCSSDKIGSRPIAQLTGHGLDDFYERLAARPATGDSTINRYHSLLRGALKQAVKWGWIDTNPALLATPPQERNREIEVPADHVIAALIDAAENTKSPCCAAIVRALAISAARRGEGCAWRWSRVDLDAGFIDIKTSIAEIDGAVIEKPTKNYQSRRIPIDPETVACLRRHRRKQEARAVKRGGVLAANAFVFPNLDVKRGGCANGTVPIRPSGVSQAFRRLCQKVPGAESMRLHDLRHWAASTMLDDGEPVTEVAARLGDHVETVVRTYVHGRRGHERHSAQPLADRLRRP